MHDVSVTIGLESPLELHLKQVAEERASEFPNRDAPYFEQYVNMKHRLADKYYAVAGSSLSRKGDRYTKHDISHVDDVIDAAGKMLGFGSEAKTPAYESLHPYEVFVLLLAILLHDAGNAVGREGHEKRAGEILREISGGTSLNPLEKRIIAMIAQAHGGQLETGDQDTITGLITDPEPNVRDIKVHARRLAAIVRLADELSENDTRADEVAIDDPSTPDLSVLSNLYCQCINPRIDYEGRSVHLQFHVDRHWLPKVFKVAKDAEEVMFVDYIASRIEKCERERRYCHRFLAGFASFERIRVKLTVLDDDEEIETLSVDLEELGYPSLSKKVKELEPKFDACSLRDKHFVARERVHTDEC